MRPLNRLSTRKLFIIYITLSVLLLGSIGGWVVHHQSVRVIASLQQETIEVELQTAKRYLLQYLNDREMAFRRVTTLPKVIASVSQPEPPLTASELISYINEAQVFSKKSQIAIFKQDGHTVIDNLGSSLNHQKIIKAVGRILSGAPSDVLMQLMKDRQQQHFLLYLPIINNHHIQGVLVCRLDFDLAYFFSTIVNNYNRWIGLSQPSTEIEMYPPDSIHWNSYEEPLGYSDLVMNYAVNTQVLADQRKNLLYQLGGMLLVALLLSFIAIYLLGEKLLLRPFLELSKNREQLAHRTHLLAKREAEAKRLAQVAQHAHDAIVITDNEQLITWVNDAFVELTGYQREEVIGLNPGKLLQGPDTDHQTRYQLACAITEQRNIRAEVLNYRKDGHSYWVDIDITPVFNGQHELESFIAVQRDISTQRELQSDLRQALRRAKEANNAKLRFLANMSHEIRTPMNGVLGLAQLLEQSELEPQQRRYINDLYHSGQHMMALLNDILDFSKIEAQQLQLEATPFNLTEILEGIRSTYSALAEKQQIQFTLKNRAKHQQLIADRDRIRQIILNLVSNAMKFTREGEVSLTLKDSYYKGQLHLLIRVKDSGIGIAPDRQKQIFDPFTQAESSTTRQYGGSGLGLAIVRQICHAMGGEVRLRSHPGKGSTFTAIIQTAPGNEAPNSAVIPSEQFDGHGYSVLIAEDNRTNAMILKAFLTKRGFNCELALNGKEAIEKMQRQSFPFVLMDNHMPQVDGIEATQVIRRLRAPQSYSLIIGCTADAFSDTRNEMLSAGVNDVLTKPLSSDKLDQLLHRYQEHFNSWHQWQKIVPLEQQNLQQLNRWLADTDITPVNKRHRIQDFLELLGERWATLNAALTDTDKATIIETTTLLEQQAEAIAHPPLGQYAHELKRLVGHAQLPGPQWLAEFQQLLRQTEQTLQQWIRLNR